MNSRIAIENRVSWRQAAARLQRTRNPWNASDAFEVTNGYPALDQIGRGRDAGADRVQPQTLEPVYAWNNKYNGGPCDLKVRRFYPREEEYIQEGRDFFNALKSGYTPLSYPHPVVAADTAGGTPGQRGP
jgi:hypothetical protein